MPGAGEGACGDQVRTGQSGGIQARAELPDATGQPGTVNHPGGSGSFSQQHTGSTTGLGAADFGVPDQVRCPFCAGDETELHSAFGGQLSTSTYWCRRCRTAFEWFKWEKR